MQRLRPRALEGLLSLLLVGLAAEVEAATPKRAQIGRCASYLKRLQNVGTAAGIARHDLYEGLTGWIAMKAGVNPAEVDGLGAGAPPDAVACQDFGLAPEPLLALESVAAKVPADRVREVAEGCLAALRVLDRLNDEGPRREPARAVYQGQSRTVGRLLGYVAKNKKPAPGAVEARMEALLREPGAPGTSPGFGQALQGCGHLGVDTDLVRRTHGAS